MSLWWKIKDLGRRILLLDPKFLCDDCRYNYHSACNRRERPNAIQCPDYKKK